MACSFVFILQMYRTCTELYLDCNTNCTQVEFDRINGDIVFSVTLCVTNFYVYVVDI